jgi:hypothetical protein
MTMKLMFRDRHLTKGPVALELSQPALEALAGEDDIGSNRAAKRMEAAVRCYLSDKGSGRPAWPYPAFLRGSQVQEDVRLEMDIDVDLWTSFESEAETQGVSIQQLAEHAAFYLAAEIDAGRITQRILDDLESTDADS